jgi:PIN domain nuclease of toxin-antitoxin system
MAPSIWFERALASSGVELLPITSEIAITSVSLPDIHRDPFDRIIIATALSTDSVLVSADGNFGRYPDLQGRLLTPQS